MALVAHHVAFEFIPTLAVLIGAPDLKILLASSTPFSDFVALRGGRWLSIAVSLGVALAIVNAMIAIVLVHARFFYASGRDRAWAPPINAALTRVSRRCGSPWVANLTAGVLASLGCFVHRSRPCWCSPARLWSSLTRYSVGR